MKVPPDIEKARRDVQGNAVPKEQKSHYPAIHPLDITHHGSTSGNGIAKSKRRSSYSCGDLKTRENKKKKMQEILQAASTNTRRRSGGGMDPRRMRSKSLISLPQLMAQSCACFAPLPDYAKYQERKIQRELSRTCIFTDEPSSPLKFESRKSSKKEMIRSKSLNLTDAISAATAATTSSLIQEKAATSGSLADGVSASSPPASSSPSSVVSAKLAKSVKTRMVSTIKPPQLECMDEDDTSSTNPSPKVPSVATLEGYDMTVVVDDDDDDDDDETSGGMQIEVSPGVSTRVRSVGETMTAIRNDFFVPVFCLGCALDLFCIADAQFVLCPACRVVSPVEAQLCTSKDDTKPRGLGLGVRYENLVEIQSEILATPL
ncbi:expressed unknown protein [Seminavis robusta]|uniref:Uncharacterized protein n=1 Tax=Seminavis robusta TaxID=568900 RepID=A0A9N8EZF2_9STRA|nr:expressed unknown protein [Seminavis robusta]|eukprot:Sro2666_g334180.1 n/a (375) ;mRNA; r:6814-7938